MSRPTLSQIIDGASQITKFAPEDIRGPRRWRPLVRVRQAVCWIAYDEGRGLMSMTEIARRMNDRDHASISHGIRVARNLLDRDKRFGMLVDGIRDATARLMASQQKAVANALAEAV